MSVTAQSLPALTAGASRLGLRLALALAAIAAVTGAVATFVWLFGPTASPPNPRSPFGAGLREAAPSAQGLGVWILAIQGGFYRSLQAAVLALKSNGAALWSLTGIGFAYGVFHAAGPGHGKAVIAAYLVSSERALLKGLGMSLAAALVQALVAVALVGVAAVLLHATAATISRVTNAAEIASFAAVAALGALLVWRKAGKIVSVAMLAYEPRGYATTDACCDHAHLPPPEAIDRIGCWREAAGVVLAAGLRPCAGAIIVLVFALAWHSAHHERHRGARRLRQVVGLALRRRTRRDRRSRRRRPRTLSGDFRVRARRIASHWFVGWLGRELSPLPALAPLLNGAVTATLGIPFASSLKPGVEPR
jgi:nickel/cobalt exporter